MCPDPAAPRILHALRPFAVTSCSGRKVTSRLAPAAMDFQSATRIYTLRPQRVEGPKSNTPGSCGRGPAAGSSPKTDSHRQPMATTIPGHPDLPTTHCQQSSGEGPTASASAIGAMPLSLCPTRR